MHYMKLLGQSLMARDFERQVAEIQIRIAVLNRYNALGIPVTEPTAQCISNAWKRWPVGDYLYPSDACNSTK